VPNFGGEGLPSPRVGGGAGGGGCHPEIAGHADDKDSLPLDLSLGQEDVDGAAVAGFDDDGDAGRLLTATAGLFLVVEIGDQVVDASRIPDQPVGLGRIVDKGRTGAAARAGLVADAGPVFVGSAVR